MVETEGVNGHVELWVEDQSHNSGVGAVTQNFVGIGRCCKSYLERGGAKIALRAAGSVLEAVVEVCFGIGAVTEERCTVGDWNLSRDVGVVDAQCLTAGVAVGTRESVLPAQSSSGQPQHQELNDVRYTCSGSACLMPKDLVKDTFSERPPGEFGGLSLTLEGHLD